MNTMTSSHDEAALCADLLTAVDALSRRRAHLIDEAKVDQFVRQGWLSWEGGALRVTPIGVRVCDAALLAFS